MKRLDEIFDIWYGVNLEVVNCEVVENGIPFVSRQSVNNGIVCHVKQIDGLQPNPANTLSIAASGSVLSTYFHEYEYYSGRDVYIAKPKKPLHNTEMLFYCAVIEHNKYRYNYGRAANRTLRNILIPSIDEIPIEYRNKQIKSPFSETPLLSKCHELFEDEWEWFCLLDLFNYKKGRRLTKSESTNGDIPLVTAGKENNGISRNISNMMDIFFDVITIDMFGYCVYREYKFCCDDNIIVLFSKTEISKYAKIFLATIIDRDSYKCTYGRQYRQKTLRQHKIKLPVTNEGLPDWQFMENYIKGLPYSANI